MRRRAIWLSALAVAVIVSCGGDSELVEGRITEFDGDLSAVRSFRLVDTAGTVFDFVPDATATFHGGPLSHLRDHLISGEAVVVHYEVRGGSFVALSVEDR